MQELTISGTSKIHDHEIHEEMVDLLNDLIATDINNRYPGWTGDIKDWIINLPSVDFEYSATIVVDGEEYDV